MAVFDPTVPINFRVSPELRRRIDAEARAASPSGRPKVQAVAGQLMREALDQRDKNRAAVEAAQLKLSLTPEPLPIVEARRSVGGQAVQRTARKAHEATRGKAAKAARARAVPQRKPTRRAAGRKAVAK